MIARPVALITGAAHGIGEAVAHRLAHDGYGLVLVDRDAAALDTVTGSLPPGTDVLAVPGDVRVSACLEEAVRRASERFGRLDVVVTCAGVNAYFDAVEMTEADWDDVFAVDLKATWLTCRAALPLLLASDRASIVTISSIHGRLTTPGMFPYAAAKAGVEGLTRSLAVDYGPSGVRVNAVAPGWTRTRLVDDWLQMQPSPDAARAAIDAAHPLQRIAEPGEIASVVAFLAGSDARAVTGTTVHVDCGLSIKFAGA